jgi:hypothetical protein
MKSSTLFDEITFITNLKVIKDENTGKMSRPSISNRGLGKPAVPCQHGSKAPEVGMEQQTKGIC